MMENCFEYLVERVSDSYENFSLDTRIGLDCVRWHDDVLAIVEGVLRVREVSPPSIESWNSYYWKLIRHRGVRLRDLLGYALRIPEWDFSRVTVRELCDAVESGAWSLEAQRKLLGSYIK